MKQITTSQEQKSQVRSVLLLTDGLANNGIRVPAVIIKKIKKLQEENFSSELSFSTLKEQSTSPPLKYRSQALVSPQEQPLEEATASVLPSTENVSTLASMALVHDVTEELDDSLHTKPSLKLVKLYVYISCCICMPYNYVCTCMHAGS